MACVALFMVVRCGAERTYRFKIECEDYFSCVEHRWTQCYGMNSVRFGDGVLLWGDNGTLFPNTPAAPTLFHWSKQGNTLRITQSGPLGIAVPNREDVLQCTDPPQCDRYIGYGRWGRLRYNCSMVYDPALAFAEQPSPPRYGEAAKCSARAILSELSLRD